MGVNEERMTGGESKKRVVGVNECREEEVDSMGEGKRDVDMM